MTSELMDQRQPETDEPIYDEETVTTQIHVIETRTALTSMDAEPIVMIKIKPDLLMTLVDVRADMAAVRQLTQAMSHRACSICGGHCR